MKQYLNFSRSNRVSYSFKHSFGLIFGKIETVFFCFLSIFFLITSRINEGFYQDISFAFNSISMPVVKVVSFPFNATINLLTDFNALVNAKKENKELKEELEKMRSFYIRSLNIHSENKELKKILNFVTPRSSNFKAARIIGKSHQMFSQKVLIDAGKDRDLQENSVVTGTKGIIGRIIEVGEDKSRIMLITDASSRIPVIASNARVRGILAGDGSGLMEILYLPKNHSIKQGERIFTSGDGDTLPMGLLVGVVRKVGDNYAAVQMIENINNIDVVTIISH